MINEIIREVKLSLKNGCYMAALTLALTLPDICGKAKFPNEKSSKKRYIQWFDEYIGKYEHDEENIEKGLPYLSGDLVYSLRCSILHQGDPNIEKSKYGIILFELLYRQQENINDFDTFSESEIIKDDQGNEKAKNIKYSVNVRKLCFKLCNLAKYYYDKYKDKFIFLNSIVYDNDYQMRNILYFNINE